MLFPLMKQVGIEKSATGINSSIHFGGYKNWDNLNLGLLCSSLQPIPNKNMRKRDCKEVLFAFFYTINKPSGKKYDSRNLQHMTINVQIQAK